MISRRPRWAAAAVALAAVTAGAPLPSHATGDAAPTPSAAARNRSAQLPKGLTLPIPREREHTEFVVETNKKGQVVRVVTGKQCSDRTFNAFTYGNVLQAFIRTPDGRAVPGTYRLSYDYDPKTLVVKRDVALIEAGHVDVNAEGAVDEMADIAKRHAERDAQEQQKNATPLPNFRDITGHK